MAETEAPTPSGVPDRARALGVCLVLLSRFARTENRRGGVSRLLDSADQPSESPQELAERVEGLRALVIIGLDGEIHDRLVLDDGIDSNVLAELATLLRIACRTTEDTGAGRLLESTWSSSAGTVLARHIGGEQFVLLVGGDALRISLARYLLRKAARQLAMPS